MTKSQFNSALSQLGLSVYASPAVLKVTLRQAQRYSLGEQEVEARVTAILEMLLHEIKYLKHRRHELNEMIDSIDKHGVRVSNNNRDDTQAWRERLLGWLDEIEGLLRKHPSGLPSQLTN